MVRAALVAAVLGLGGLLVLLSGIVSIKASSGHLGVTEWLLELGKRRSVATHTLGEELDLDEPWLVLKGAGHYEIGCRPCHGAPDLARQPRVARAMTPPPPLLPPRVAEWDPEELFYIVKHGIKFTGMPAWPSQARDDEVRAVVAFLRVLPDLDGEAYRRLVHGEEDRGGEVAPIAELLEPEQVPRAVRASCARCHGPRGQGRGSAAFPKLAGQRGAYLVAALEAYAADERQSGIMQPIAAALTPDEMRELADYYSRLPASSAQAAEPSGSSAIERGRRIAGQGIPDQRLPSCEDCHGAGTGRRNRFAPRLAGQYADYLVLQLELFHDQRRGGSAWAHLMDPVASRLRPDQMRDLALYYASLGGPAP
jgi:cytochrome c553